MDLFREIKSLEEALPCLAELANGNALDCGHARGSAEIIFSYESSFSDAQHWGENGYCQQDSET